ncbi:molybdopterin-synthase adenylyltransferase MoeB [Chthonomonas calidirosea]|uniref:molybdopterin-synthase adenylyltransferase MoeB n=1 Tax=Chthonomonas calidirosea TaxID=454171 RepID=UPI0006EC4D63|nr:molybdopterin-synthase adenylyltransferase MoeB [Chthonomonas calidirosea]CEK13792.1 dinucleotide-utilizing enzyme possibly involved in molybdopterin or thiamin biosynthesis [Chthonomonas calidirosea]
MPKILVPTSLQQFVGGNDEISVGGTTVKEALDQLLERYPDLRKHLYNDKGELRHFVNIYKGADDTRALQGLETPVTDADELSIVPSIAGGVGVETARINPNALLPEERVEAVSFSNEEILRYSRHLILPEVGLEGQKRLKAAKVLLIGAGGLGSPLALYLAAAGVGTIGLVDFDAVDLTNLQRQVIHGTNDVGRSKLESAKETILDINPHVEVIGFEERFTSQNALEIARDFDIIIDGTDNFPTRYLTNDVCALLGKPNVYGSIFRFEGQASVFWAGHGPCYRCLFPEPPPPGLVPSCAEGGVLGVLPGIVGCIQAIEAIKLILGIGNPLIGRLLTFNALKMQFRELRLRRDPACPLCGENPTIHELIDYEEFCGIRGEEAPPPQLDEVEEITVQELKRRMDAGERLTIIDVREPHEYAIARIPGTQLIPLGQIEERAHELDPNQEIILHCRSGKRSAEALLKLKAKGFKHLKNLKGGILAWSEEIDPSVPKY